MEQATLRGVESFGMLCSAFDIGWASKPDGLLVDLPADGLLQEGDDCPPEPIQVHKQAQCLPPCGSQRDCCTLSAKKYRSARGGMAFSCCM